MLLYRKVGKVLANVAGGNLFPEDVLLVEEEDDVGGVEPLVVEDGLE